MKTYVVGTQKNRLINRLNETVLLSTKTHVKTNWQEKWQFYYQNLLFNLTYEIQSNIAEKVPVLPEKQTLIISAPDMENCNNQLHKNQLNLFVLFVLFV